MNGTINTTFAPDEENGSVPKRDIDLNAIRIPDLWHVAMNLHERGDARSSQVIATWSLCHDLLARVRGSGLPEEGAFKRYWEGSGQSYRSALTGAATPEAVEAMLKDAWAAGAASTVRPQTPEERHDVGIRTAFHEYYGSDPTEWDFEGAYVRVIEGYMPDGPSWTGDVAIVIGGEISFVTILTRANYGPNQTWKVDHAIDDMCKCDAHKAPDRFVSSPDGEDRP